MEDSARWGTAIEIFALQALAFQAFGDLERALPVMDKALTYAQPEGYIRTFVDLGPQVTHLLQEVIALEGNTKAYAQTLLSACQDAENQQASQKTGTLVEPLSDRELEVLSLMSQGLSGPEIADKLFVSLNTIKTHIKNIYSKLGVNKRFDAIERAKEFELI